MQGGYTVRHIGLDSWRAVLPSSEAHASSHGLGKQLDAQEVSRGPECRANAEEGTEAPGNPISRDLSSGPHACSVDALATEPYPSSLLPLPNQVRYFAHRHIQVMFRDTWGL